MALILLRPADVHIVVDAFFPMVSLAAFLSGGCFGYYAAGKLLGRW